MYSITDRAHSYLEKLPPAIAGSGGHAAAFNAAVVLVRGFAMPEEDALPLLLAWNHTHCNPPWREVELRHKLRSAANSSRPLGYLLKDAKLFGQIQGSQAPKVQEDKSHKRKTWPALRAPTLSEMESLSRLRHIPGSALTLAANAGLLHVCHYERAPCFILAEGDFAQVRRLDGQPLPVTSGLSKAKNLPGSQGAFIGAALLGEARHVLLVEGCIGLLEALGCIALTDAQNWTAIAATSASSRFKRAPALLASLKGRHVRILPDDDRAGLDAAATWLHDLERAGCRVDATKLTPGNDLGLIVADHLAHSETLNSLFQ